MTLLALSLSHRTARLPVRERVDLGGPPGGALLASLIESLAASEAVSLSTCNRTELYLEAGDVGLAEGAAIAALARVGGMPAEGLEGSLRALRGADAARHLFRVTAGLESMILGEAEIQGQVRRAYELALAGGTTGPVTNRLFQAALRAGKRVRSEIGPAAQAGSVASAALDMARAELGPLGGRRALVIGAGKHGALTGRALAAAGADTVFVASRRPERAEELAHRIGGSAAPLGELAAELRRADLVVACTSCPYRIIAAADLAAAGAGRRLVVLDTAVPRDVDPAARELSGVTLYDLDDIQETVDRRSGLPPRDSARAEAVLAEELARFERWLASLEVVPTISALRRRGLAAVERALEQNEGRWNGLSEGDRARVEVLARAVVSDLLHEPTVKLRRAGEHGSAGYAETVRELFGLG